MPLSNDAEITVTGVYDAAGNVLETHEHAGRFHRMVSVERDNEPPRGEA